MRAKQIIANKDKLEVNSENHSIHSKYLLKRRITSLLVYCVAVLNLAITISLLTSTTLIEILDVDPIYYYAIGCLFGFVSFIGISRLFHKRKNK